MSEISLTPINLAYMGIMDDFYDLYCEIKDIYEEHKKRYIHENSENAPFFNKTWDDLCLRDVRKKIEPYLNKYRSWLNIDWNELHARAYAFSEFSFVKKSIALFVEEQEVPITLSFKSFSEFCTEFLIAVTILDYKHNHAKNNRHSFADSWVNINRNIKMQADAGKNECYNTAQKVLDSPDNTLYIFDKLSNTSCWKYDHPIISARYIAMVAKTSKLIALPVHYCNHCKKYFIGRKTLTIFEKEFGKLAIIKKDISEMKWRFDCFSAESKLHSLGYNVINGRLSEDERERLLIHLIDNKLISYVELCSTIEQNINLFKNSYRHRFAVEKWTTDLKTIGEYILRYPEKKN